jgi:hypothetical protein
MMKAKALPPTNKIYQQIESFMSERPVGLRLRMETEEVNRQIIIALTMQKIVERQSGLVNSVPSLAEQIITQKWYDLEKYGERTYGFSEKQLDVIFRDFVGQDARSKSESKI